MDLDVSTQPKSHRVKHLLVICTLFLGGIAVFVAPAALAQTQSGFTYDGMVHISFWHNEYNNFDSATGAGTDSRTELATTHANWTSLLVTQYQATATSSTIAADANKTPTDTSLIVAIQELHNKGIKVMLKPHVDSMDNNWRGTFRPSNVNAWFQSYTNFIVHYAQLAQAHGVEGLVIGTELVQLTGAANRNNWIGVISAIRNVFGGTLTYAANATFPGDEFTTVSFWDHVDLLGLDAYFPLTNHSDPSIPELVSAWTSNTNGQNIVAAVQNFANAHQKPVIFTELGYKSVPGANTQPFNFSLGNGGRADDTEQNNCFEAMFQVWSKQTSFMKGVFWWSWSVPTPVVASDTDYNPRGKPVENTLKIWYAAGGGGGNLIANGTYIFTNRNSNLLVDDPGSSTMPGTRIDQRTANGGNNQKWQLTNLGSNNVKLISVASGLALDMSGQSTINGGAVIQWTPTGASNQIWHITSLGAVFSRSQTKIAVWRWKLQAYPRRTEPCSTKQHSPAVTISSGAFIKTNPWFRFQGPFGLRNQGSAYVQSQ